MNLKKMIQELLIEINAIEEWIMQLSMCLDLTDDQDPDYITLLLQEAGAIEYLEELRKRLEELMNQQEEQQQNNGEQEGDEQENQPQPQDQQKQEESQGGEDEQEQEEEQGQDEEEPEAEDDNRAPQQAAWGDEDKHQTEAGEGHVAPAPSGVNQALWNLIGEKNYLEYIKFAPIELSTRVQKGTITGREYSYKIPRPDGKIITRRSIVQRIRYNDEVIKLSYVPEIHAVIWDK